MPTHLMFSRFVKHFSASRTTGAESPSGASGDQSTNGGLAEKVLAVEARLRQSLNLADANIWCEVVGERIVLRGHVPTHSARHSARAAAEEACGCKIENQLGVVPSPLE